MSKKQILIADDDPSIRLLLRNFLEGEGYDTAEAKSGGEVLRMLPQATPDLMILDLKMPEWDGIEVMKKLGEQNLKVQTEGAERANRRVSVRRITPLIDQQAAR